MRKQRGHRKSSHKRRNQQLQIFLAIIFIAVAGFLIANTQLSSEIEVYETNSEPVTIGAAGTAHHHSTYLIFINDRMVRFDDERYFVADARAHIHDYSFAEVHSHAINVTIGFFLNTIGISFNSTCIELGSGSYCNNDTHTLKFYVEGQPNDDFGMHKTADWEHYLIMYCDETEEEITRQIERVPDPGASPPPPGKGKNNDFVITGNKL